MPIMMRGNIISEGNRNYFDIGSNQTPFFQIGLKQGDDLWLQGELAGPNEEFLFNGRLFVPGNINTGTIIDNFPKGPAPNGWYIRKFADQEGYELVSNDSEIVLFGFRVQGQLCIVTTNLIDKNGNIAVETNNMSLCVYGFPVRLGRHGIVIGMPRRAA